MTPDLDALDRLQVAIRECLSSHIGFEDTPGGKYAFTTLRLAGEQIPVLVAALRGAVEDKEWLVKQKALLEGALAHAGKIADALQAEVRGAVEERDRLRASSDCPVCGKDSPHGHSVEDITAWLNAQASRFGYSLVGLKLSLASPELGQLTAKLENALRLAGYGWSPKLDENDLAMALSAVVEAKVLRTIISDAQSVDGVTADDAPLIVDAMPPSAAWVEGYEAGQNSVMVELDKVAALAGAATP